MSIFDEDETPQERELERAANAGDALKTKMKEAAPERIRNLIGICATCTHFYYKRTKLQTEVFICERRDGKTIYIQLNDPTEECSDYNKRGTMSLWDMKEMAILIDPPSKPIGFNKDSE